MAQTSKIEWTDATWNPVGARCVVHHYGRVTYGGDIANPPKAVFALRVGKKAAGRLLDGKTHDD